jgi:hypothetical protein
MTEWNTAIVESARLYSPIGVRLIDDLTGGDLLGKVQVYLDLQDSAGVWRQQDRNPVWSMSGYVTYPGLEWHADALGLPQRQFQVRIKAEFYIPLYPNNQDGLAFTVKPYDDAHPPQVSVFPTDLVLTPAPNYPFQGHIPLLHGVVKDAANEAVPNTMVTQAAKERVLTDGKGMFALPLRWAKPNVAIPIDAANSRSGKTGTKNITPPGDLTKFLTIQIQ